MVPGNSVITTCASLVPRPRSAFNVSVCSIEIWAWPRDETIHIHCCVPWSHVTHIESKHFILGVLLCKALLSLLEGIDGVTSPPRSENTILVITLTWCTENKICAHWVNYLIMHNVTLCIEHVQLVVPWSSKPCVSSWPITLPRAPYFRYLQLKGQKLWHVRSYSLLYLDKYFETYKMFAQMIIKLY